MFGVTTPCVEAARARLEAANKPNRQLYDRLQKVVSSYCTGLAKAPLHIDRFGATHFHH